MNEFFRDSIFPELIDSFASFEDPIFATDEFKTSFDDVIVGPQIGVPQMISWKGMYRQLKRRGFYFHKAMIYLFHRWGCKALCNRQVSNWIASHVPSPRGRPSGNAGLECATRIPTHRRNSFWTPWLCSHWWSSAWKSSVGISRSISLRWPGIEGSDDCDVRCLMWIVLLGKMFLTFWVLESRECQFDWWLCGSWHRISSLRGSFLCGTKCSMRMLRQSLMEEFQNLFIYFQ